ncbi:unnamed protein product [Closterium sp. NIES-54]
MTFYNGCAYNVTSPLRVFQCFNFGNVWEGILDNPAPNPTQYQQGEIFVQTTPGYCEMRMNRGASGTLQMLPGETVNIVYAYLWDFRPCVQELRFGNGNSYSMTNTTEEVRHIVFEHCAMIYTACPLGVVGEINTQSDPPFPPASPLPACFPAAPPPRAADSDAEMPLPSPAAAAAVAVAVAVAATVAAVAMDPLPLLVGLYMLAAPAAPTAAAASAGAAVGDAECSKRRAAMARSKVSTARKRRWSLGLAVYPLPPVPGLSDALSPYRPFFVYLPSPVQSIAAPLSSVTFCTAPFCCGESRTGPLCSSAVTAALLIAPPASVPTLSNAPPSAPPSAPPAAPTPVSSPPFRLPPSICNPFNPCIPPLAFTSPTPMPFPPGLASTSPHPPASTISTPSTSTLPLLLALLVTDATRDSILASTSAPSSLNDFSSSSLLTRWILSPAACPFC